jgi:hypothetical protein
MKHALLTIFFAFLICFAPRFVPMSVYCAVDDSPAMWSGQTTSANGHMFYRFRCLQGHQFWVREN